MSDEIVMAKVNAFANELKELGVEDFIFAAGSSSGLLAIQYDGDPRGVCFLAMSALMNAMFDSIDNDTGEISHGGREDYGE
tara:strand:- start:1879 stop:2121 length:243 start_codon:yes stop_codon:yes gene_type:complete